MEKWDAREWLAGLMGLDKAELAVRSIDRYGSRETQVRYEQGDRAVARLTVIGPVREVLEGEGEGAWKVKVQIGHSNEGIHDLELPETTETVY